MSEDRYVLIYDGHCGFCRREAARLSRWARGRVQLESFHDPGVLKKYPMLTQDRCEQALQLVTPGGSIYSGAEAVARAAMLHPVLKRIAPIYFVPGIRQICNCSYRLIAENRFRLPGDTCSDGSCTHNERRLSPPPPYSFVSRLFLSVLGAVYLMAFGSLAVQVRHLIGHQGLLPLREFLPTLTPLGVSRFWQFPMIFWLSSHDAVLVGGTGAGLVLALSLMAGYYVRPCLIGLWILFLSYVTACRTFCYFQWDNMLLEATFLAFFLPPAALFKDERKGASPHPFIVFLFWWLLFRLYFESGLIKIEAGPAWRDLTAMALYYETAPLPTWLGWWAHQMPMSGHKISSAATLMGELLVPLLIFAGRRARLVAFAFFLPLQIGILLTANYGYFNYLSIAISLFLLGGNSKRADETEKGKPRDLLFGGLVTVVGALSLLEFLLLVVPPGQAQRLWRLRDFYAPFRVVNSYHLFGSITPTRDVVELQGTQDGQTWSPYYLCYTPGDPRRAPPLIAPHQPRLDFQWWFLTLGGEHEYFNTFVERICNAPEAVQHLFSTNPSPRRPPQAVRVAVYRYRMTDRKTRAETGAWWSRQLLGYHPQIYRCDSSEPPRY